MTGSRVAQLGTSAPVSTRAVAFVWHEYSGVVAQCLTLSCQCHVSSRSVAFRYVSAGFAVSCCLTPCYVLICHMIMSPAVIGGPCLMSGHASSVVPPSMALCQVSSVPAPFVCLVFLCLIVSSDAWLTLSPGRSVSC